MRRLGNNSRKQVPQTCPAWVDIDPDDLPICLIHGLPPPLTHLQSTTFWGAHRQDLHTSVAGGGQQSLGIPKTTARARLEAECKDLETAELLQDTHTTLQGSSTYNARQAFQALRGPHEPTTTIALPQACADPAPTNINAYSDGSLHDPTHSIFA